MLSTLPAIAFDHSLDAGEDIEFALEGVFTYRTP